MMGNWRGEFTDSNMGQGFAVTFGISTRHLLDLNAEGRCAALDEGFSPSKVMRAGKMSTRKHEAGFGNSLH
jgi:hypothetical protein